MWAPLPLPTPEWLDESGQPLLPPSVEYELLRGGRDDPVAEVFTAELLAEVRRLQLLGRGAQRRQVRWCTEAHLLSKGRA